MALIGGVAVDIMKGLPQVLKTRLDVWEVAGLDGYGAQQLGLGDAEFNLTTIFYALNNAAANTFLNNCEALEGTLISLTDDWGDVYQNVLVKHVDSTTPNGKHPCIYQGNANYVRVQLCWTLISS